MNAPALAPISTKATPAEVRREFEKLRVFFAGMAKGGGLPTLRDLVNAGIIGGIGPGGELLPGSGAAEIPHAPLGFAVSGAFSTILLKWHAANYRGHSHAEIWRAQVDDLGEAVMIATSTSFIYGDTPPSSSLSETYYYWIRFVNIDGIPGPFNALEGTPGSTADDPAYLLEVLSNQITESQLYKTLAGRIDLISSPAFNANAPLLAGRVVMYEGKAYRLLQDFGLDDLPIPTPPNETYWELVLDYQGLLAAANAHKTLLQAHAEAITGIQESLEDVPVFDEDAAEYLEDNLVRYDGGLYRAIQDMTSPPHPLPTDIDYWQKIGDYASIGEAVAAHAVAISDLETAVTTAEGTISSHSSALTALDNRVTDTEEGVSGNSSAITGLDSRVTSAEGSISSQATAVTAISSRLSAADLLQLLYGFDADNDGFTTSQSSLTWQTGGTTLWSTTGSNPYFQKTLATADRFTGSVATVVQARIRRVSGTGTWLGRCQFVTNAYTSYSVNRRKDIAIPADPDEWNILEWDMTDLTAGGTDWLTGEIRGLRLALVSNSGSIWEVDWVKVVKKAITRTDEQSGANATAISGLDTRVTSAEGTITTQAGQITSLSSDLDTLSGTVSTQGSTLSGHASAISGLDTRVTSAEGSIATQAGQITSLSSDLDTLSGTVSGHGSTLSGHSTAISGLDTRVTSAEGTITTQATALTQLSSRVGTADDAMMVHAFTADLEGWLAGAASISWQDDQTLNFTGTSSNPYITKWFAVADRFQGSLATVVKARVRRTDGTQALRCRVYFQTQIHTSYTIARYKEAPDPEFPDIWNIIEWDMAALDAGGNDWVNNEIRGIRIDFNTAAGSTWKVDWVKIVKPGITRDQVTLQQHGETIDGLGAQWSIKIDNNGFMSGFGLASEPRDGTPFSEFYVLADRFAVINPAVTPLTVTSITRSGGTATATTSAAHGLTLGDHVVITGAAQKEYNGTHKVAQIVTATEFQYVVSGSPVTPATVAPGFSDLRAHKGSVPFVIEGGKVVMDVAYVFDLTAANFVGQKIIADEVAAGISVSAPIISGGRMDVANAGMLDDPGGLRFWAGASYANRYNAPFKVGDTGHVFCNDIYARGDIQATGLQVGTAMVNTANIVDAAIKFAKIGDAEVGTLKVAGDSITVAVSAHTAGTISLPYNTWTTVQSASRTATGSHILIFASVRAVVEAVDEFARSPHYLQWRLRRGTTTLRSGEARVVHDSSGADWTWLLKIDLDASFMDAPAAGTYTYTLEVNQFVSSWATPREASARSLFLLERLR